MEKEYIEDKTFEQQDFSKQALPKGDYENCRFINCHFADGDVSGVNFVDGIFTDCNMSMARMVKTGFKTVQFNGCKLLGVHFDTCNDISFVVNFDHCILNLASFYKRKMKQAVFNHCTLQEVDFSEADLTNASFDYCDLAGATFDNTILEKADFSNAFQYSINPSTNRIKKAIFSRDGIEGLLHQFNIVIA